MGIKAEIIEETIEETRYKNYIKKLRSVFGDDFDFIFCIWLEALESEATLELDKKLASDLTVGYCNDYDKIIVHAICFADPPDQARLTKILITRISDRLGIPKESPIKIKGNLEIVYEN